jgi:hypothetical protein
MTAEELVEAIQSGHSKGRTIREGDVLAASDPLVRADRERKWFVPAAWPTERKRAHRAAVFSETLYRANPSAAIVGGTVRIR